jgi:hypothetical protein
MCGNKCKQDRQRTYDETLRSFREYLLPRKSKKYYIFVCVCARAQVRACLRVDGCVTGRVALFIQHATRIRDIVTSFVVPPIPPHFATLSRKRHDFRRKGIAHTICVFIFYTTFV